MHKAIISAAALPAVPLAMVGFSAKMSRFSSCGLLLVLVGCGPRESLSDRVTPRLERSEPLTDAFLFGATKTDLEQRYARLGDEAGAASDPDVAVARHRDAARTARIVALRFEAPEWLLKARDALRLAARSRRGEGVCQAGVDLARFEASDRSELAEAYLSAYRVIRRFESDERCRTSVADATRMLAILDPFRPSDAELAAIDADPHETHSQEPVPSIEEWIAGRVSSEPFEAALTEVSVYGERGARTARVVLRFDHVATFSRTELAPDGDLPRRAVLDFQRTSLGSSLAPMVPVRGGGVARARMAQHDGGVTRVAFDLDGEHTDYRLFFLTDPYRVVLDFDRSGREGRAAPLATLGSRLRVVVLDPGHGGEVSGAAHGGLKESDITLDIAQRLARRLLRRLPAARVLLTRNDDRALSLEQRVAFANAVDADVFISIHVNAADEAIDRGGTTTFVLDTTDDQQALRLAARENGTSTAEVTELQRVLATLHRADQGEQSRALAQNVQRGMVAGGRRILPDLEDRGVRSAMFYVLVGARMPAVLAEVSFLSQPDERRALATTEYRDALADGLCEGIVRYGAADP